MASSTVGVLPGNAGGATQRLTPSIPGTAAEPGTRKATTPKPTIVTGASSSTHPATVLTASHSRSRQVLTSLSSQLIRCW